MIFPFGPLYNALLIIAGSLLGIGIGRFLPDRIRLIVFQGLGLCTLTIGMQMALLTAEPLVLVLSLLLGGILGELIGIEDKCLALGTKLKSRFGKQNPQFSEGFVNASILFCVGAMAILGSFEEGLKGEVTITMTKSIMDAFASIALASAYGIGVAFSGLSVFIYQGLLVVFASSLQSIISPEIMNELTALGGVMILAISLNLFNLLQIRLSNFLPALLIIFLVYPLVTSF